MKKNYLLILVTVIFFSSWAHAQSISPFVISSAGGEGESGEMTIQWTLGEMMIETFDANDMILTQGFHQPHLIVTSVDEIPGHDICIDAYPNPTDNHVHIRLNDGEYADMHYSLFDSNGRLIGTRPLESLVTQVNLTQHEPGVFFLIITRSNEEIKTFKIVKNR